MKTIEIKLYSFDELSEDAREKAINDNVYINIHDDWYDFTYQDAEEIGIKINGFDIDRGSYCNIGNILDWEQVANKILENHGESTDMYKLAETFLKERDEIIDSAERDENGDFGNEYELDSLLDDLEDSFKNNLSECYLSILRNDYEYLISEDAITDTLISNEYDFTEDGKIY